MNFFTNLINWIRGKNANNKIISSQPMQATQQRPLDFVFGTIISGEYSNWKHDPHPTILCLGNYYHPNRRSYVHGIQLHEIDSSDLNWLMYTIEQFKQNLNSTNPRAFFNYLKLNRPSIIRNGYRWYHTELTNFKTVNPGFSNISEQYCIEPTDYRDSFLKLKQKSVEEVNPEKLKQSINEIINTRKI